MRRRSAALSTGPLGVGVEALRRNRLRVLTRQTRSLNKLFLHSSLSGGLLIERNASDLYRDAPDVQWPARAVRWLGKVSSSSTDH
jgi:hypothetical protein